MHLQLLGLRHVALNVADIEACVRFYRDVFGMTVEWEPDPDNVYLTSGGDNLALHRIPEDQRPSGPQAVHHIGFVVATPGDVDALARKVQELGLAVAQPLKDHRDGARSFYLRDPGGVLIQVLYHPPIHQG
jgi:catechol 2,3-dioxygenase-like lactoylglutathione lyase family enzyme